MYQEIFKQGKIGNITLKNRLVMSPMGTSLAEMDGSPSEDMIAFYEARAIGGAALIIPEIARVNDLHGAGMMRQLSVSKDRHIEGLAKLAETVHKLSLPYKLHLRQNLFLQQRLAQRPSLLTFQRQEKL